MKRLTFILTSLLCAMILFAQTTSTDKLTKRERKRNLVVKEWNTDGKTKTRYLDHMTTYDANGMKLEEVEYTTYGQKERNTYEYNEVGKVIKRVVYDDKDRPYRIYKYEYNPDGTKHKRYCYSPQGKLLTTKVYEYIYGD